VAWLLARSIASPLRRLARGAADLPDDLDLRVDETRGPVEVRAVAHALNSTAARLAGLVRRTQRVAADASHHLRTPLTGVRLRLEAIEDLSDQSEVQAEARAATREVDRLARRIDQVLALTRADAGSAALVRQSASEVVMDRVEAAEGMFDEREVDLTADVVPDVVVDAPAGLVERIVDELLSNALQYASSRVQIRLALEPEWVLLRVEDDGPGLPTAERDVVFERFVRGRDSVPGGTGLGLAMVRESAVALGGSASAGPTLLGQGTGLAVTVRLPRVR
jgi:signal transduction histidine kinase